MNWLLGLAAAILPAFCGPLQAAEDPKPGKPASSTETPTLIEAVCTLAGQQLHQTYLNLDGLSEYRFYGVLTAGELAHRLTVAIASAEETELQLKRVEAIKGLTKEDKAAVARMRKIAGLVLEQGNSLQKYWDTGVKATWQKSEAAGKSAIKELEEVLDLNPKKGIAPAPREPGKKR